MKAAALAVAAAVLAGCLQEEGVSFPEPVDHGPLGAAVHDGDCVTVRYQAFAPDGAELANGTVRFRIGGNMSGLGTDVEASVAGRSLNESWRFHSDDDEGRSAGPATMHRVFGPHDIERNLSQEEFLAGNPFFDLDNATEGRYVHVHPWYDGEYVAHDATHVTVRYTPTADQLYHPLPPYPIAVRTVMDPDNGTFSEVREPTRLNETFTVGPPPDRPFPSCFTDLQLVPGTYRATRTTPTSILLDMEPALDLPGRVVFLLGVEATHPDL